MLNNCTLLYVEDDKNMRDNMKILLEDELKTFYVAKDGLEGLQIFEDKNPDIIITDIQMPNLDGLEMSKKIKEINKYKPILLLSSFDNIDTLKYAIDIGIDSFISKPFTSIDVLFDKLNKFAQEIQNYKDAKRFKKLHREKEKAITIYNMLSELSHQWRQPLSIITTITSGYIYKKENGMQSDQDDIEMAHLVNETAVKLAKIIDEITDLDIKKTNIQELEKVIQVCNPSYERLKYEEI